MKQKIPYLLSDGAKCTHIVQDLSFQLGHNLTEKMGDKHMATVLKVSRGHYMPPPFTNVTDWFHYAFTTSEIKGTFKYVVILKLYC